MEIIVKELLQKCFMHVSNSPFLSLVILKKKSRGWRLCVDYRFLNAITVKDRFPIPMIDELLGKLNGATLFSKLDLLLGIIGLAFLNMIFLRHVSNPPWLLRVQGDVIQPHECTNNLSRYGE